MKTIWGRYWEIQDKRRQIEKELMRKYDEEVYYPAIKILRIECGKEGHIRGKFHNNGIGWTWYWCTKCGAAFDKEGPEKEVTE